MKTPKHTKGPWEYRKSPSYHSVAQVGSPVDLARLVNHDREANAHLIAAAPEMYETLEACLKLIQDPDASEFDADKIESMIESVLKKAKKYNGD